MLISGFQKTTLLDYPGLVACTVFTGGCNMRCPFCHNAGIVLNPEDNISSDEVYRYINRRKFVYDGVCITGGEPTLNKDLPEFLYKIKSSGLKVKLDTNGLNPSAIMQLISGNLVDYIAMDIKSSVSNYDKASGIETIDTDRILMSIDYIMNCKIDYEFRTTLVKGIHTYDDMEEIGEMISGAKRYFLQSFKDSGDIIAKHDTSENKPVFDSFSEDELNHFLEIARITIPEATLRGV